MEHFSAGQTVVCIDDRNTVTPLVTGAIYEIRSVQIIAGVRTITSRRVGEQSGLLTERASRFQIAA